MNHIKCTQNLSAFILAAGLGERLLPITHHIPKPLLPILGKPVLQSIIENLIAIPIHTIGINLHHKKHLIESWIRQSEYLENITLFPEDPILGTGGALKNAEGFLKNSPFLVHNSDIISDIDLGRLIESHISSGNIATLAVHNHPELNRLEVDASGLLTGFISCRKCLEDGWKPVAFTGIAVYQADFLQFLPKGNSSVVDAWFHALSARHKIGTCDVTGCYWTDIGTPSAYARAITHEMKKNGESVHIHQSVKGCDGAALDGYVVIEKDTIISKGILMRNCISLSGAIIENTSSGESSPEHFPTLSGETRDKPREEKVYENRIVGPDFIVQLSESDFYHTENHDTFLIGTGGSDRRYYRIRKTATPAVLMQCAEDDPDFQRHIEYTTFFRTYAVPVPELLDVKQDIKSALFEDLGDLSLYNWLKCPRSADQAEDRYRNVLDILILIQTTASAHVQECPLLNSRIFDYEHLRWETNYFLERFVQGMKNIRIKDRSTLDSDLHKLAWAVDSFPKTIVHRDFQSQNILIAKGISPRILDYQGARIGPPAYDVVSLLWDPYYRLEDSVRERLLTYYVNKVTDWPSFGKEFLDTLLPCRLQRHMQALGAYAFLSSVKGKNYFQKYVPEGLRLLREDISLANNQYPALHDLVTQL